jgi:hypothetical protein
MPPLPKGHPDIATMRAAAATRPSGKSAALFIRAVQGTKGGPTIAGDPVTVELFYEGEVVKKVEAKLNSEGNVLVQELPPLGVQPLVKINHAGVEYVAEGDVLDFKRPQQRIDVTVYEATEQVPAWHVHMRHLMVQPVAGGVEVMDMLVVQNPADRAWVAAAPGPDGKGKGQTFDLALPAGAKDVKLSGGFHDCCVKFEHGRIINTM